MGLEFAYGRISWPTDCSPDWEALSDAAGDISEEAVERICEWHYPYYIDDEEEDPDYRETACDLLRTATDCLRTALVNGSRGLTVVRVGGTTVMIDGGITLGEGPTSTWPWTMTVATAACLMIRRLRGREWSHAHTFAATRLVGGSRRSQHRRD